MSLHCRLLRKYRTYSSSTFSNVSKIDDRSNCWRSIYVIYYRTQHRKRVLCRIDRSYADFFASIANPVHQSLYAYNKALVHVATELHEFFRRRFRLNGCFGASQCYATELLASRTRGRKLGAYTFDEPLPNVRTC